MRLIRSTLPIEERVLVMGILNLTPDSFSDGGRYHSDGNVERAVERALDLEAAGADILDIGGESTRPGAVPVPIDEELARIAPVLERLRGRIRIPISIDTTKSGVARRAIELGAEIINDISGLRFDEELALVAAETGAGLVIMHSRGNPATMQKLPPMIDPLREVTEGLAAAVGTATGYGVGKEKIVVDPGIGFGKTVDHNLELIGRIDQLGRSLGLPVLLGTSRKSFIRLTLDRLVPGRRSDELVDRLAGTAASLVIGVLGGARILRVHDVSEAVAIVRLTEEMVRFGGLKCSSVTSP